jgi:PAS domain S-box-containing protein
MLVEKMNEGALTLNQEGIIFYCNSRFASLINQPLLQVIGTSFSQYIPATHQREYRQMIKRGWEKNFRGDFIIHPSGKEPMHIQLSLNPIDTSEGIVLSMVVTDLTEIKNAYNQLEKTKEELKILNINLERIVIERTNDVNNARNQLELSNNELLSKNEELLKINIDLDNFIYTASHDLKAPISNIEGLLEVLKNSFERQSLDETDLIFKMINLSVNRFKGTIQDLTNITKAQKGTNDDLEELDCLQVIEDVKLSINDMIWNSQAHIKVDVNHCNKIKFSKKNFTSIIYNLISNGIKYRKPDRFPEIFIKAVKLDGFILISVTDNGLGISESNIEKIFTMFKRFHDHVEGTGIGLYIVKRIIENAGGKIEVDSELDKGTTFNIYLPYA